MTWAPGRKPGVSSLLANPGEGSAEAGCGVPVFIGRYNYLKTRCSEFCCFALKRHFVVAKGFIIIFRFSMEESLLCIRA